MKLIFESETELGRCDADRVNSRFGNDPGDWVAFAHTTAAMTSAKGMLRIEQRCYLRSAERPDDLRAQSWVKPAMAFEPMLSSKQHTIQMVQKAHDLFVRKSREEFLEASVLSISNGLFEYRP